MTITVVTPLPSLSRADPTFRGDVNNFFDTLLPAFTVESNQQALDIAAVGAQVTADKVLAAGSVTAAASQVTLAQNQVALASTQALAAQTAAEASAASAGALRWVSTTFNDGYVAWSPINRQLYRKNGAGFSAVDPSLDSVGWFPIGQNTAYAMPANNIDCNVSNYFTKTVAGATTLTFSNIPGVPIRYGCILRVQHTSGIITWPAGVVWPQNLAPVLTTGRRHLFFFLTDDGGTTWRASYLVNFMS